jgi:HSP20 family protein
MIPTWQDHLEMAADEIFRPFWTVVQDQHLPANIHELDDKFVLEVSIPGIAPKDVKVEFESKTLTVEAKRSPPTAGTRLIREMWTGTATRKFYLQNVNGDAITAKFENGLLIVEAPKQAPARRSIKIV